MTVPEEPPAMPEGAGEPPPEAGPIVLAVSGSIAPSDVPGLCQRIRLMKSHPAVLVICDVGSVVDPDAVVVDALARLQLSARRFGCEVRLRNACAELLDLLDLTGLGEVVPTYVRLALEPSGEVEQREPASGVEEERDPGDPIP